MGGSGGGSSSAESTTTRYAPYVEDHHHTFLNLIETYRASTIGTSPYSTYVDVDPDAAFFGTGYTISSFPTMYDMYGKFMAGLDIETLWDQIFDTVVDGTVTKNLVTAEADLLDDDIETNVIPRMQTGMRDMNAVMSSTYVVQRSIIESTRTNALAKFSAELKYRMIPVAESHWEKHLAWNYDTIRMYAEIIKLYYAVKNDMDDNNYSMASKDALWPFTVLEYERVAVAALQGAMNTQSEVAGSSKAAKSIGGALTGAAAGAMVTGGSPVGATVGGVVGLAAGLFS